MKTAATTVDEYIAQFPQGTQDILQEIRRVLSQELPAAEEAIRYAIPTFILNKKNLVHFAAFKNHIGFYPAPVGMEKFAKELAPYKTGRGSVQFPLNKPIPYDLIRRITQFRVAQAQS